MNGKSLKQLITIAFNILYVPYSTKEIRNAYKWKHSIKSKNQLIILMITDGENDIILL